MHELFCSGDYSKCAGAKGGALGDDADMMND